MMGQAAASSLSLRPQEGWPAGAGPYTTCHAMQHTSAPAPAPLHACAASERVFRVRRCPWPARPACARPPSARPVLSTWPRPSVTAHSTQSKLHHTSQIGQGTIEALRSRYETNRPHRHTSIGPRQTSIEAQLTVAVAGAQLEGQRGAHLPAHGPRVTARSAWTQPRCHMPCWVVVQRGQCDAARCRVPAPDATAFPARCKAAAWRQAVHAALPCNAARAGLPAPIRWWPHS